MRWTLLAAWLVSACGPDVEPYSVTHEIYPTTGRLAHLSSVDFDGDDYPDNQVGMVIAALYVVGLDPNAGGDAHIDAGELVQGLELNGSAELAPAEQITINFFGDVFTLALREPQIVLDVKQDAEIRRGIIAGAVLPAEVDAAFVPPFARELDTLIASQCTARTQPDCGCAAIDEYDARYFLMQYDAAPQDCTITADEIRAGSLTQSALEPDLTIDGRPMLSFGIRFEAVPASR